MKYFEAGTVILIGTGNNASHFEWDGEFLTFWRWNPIFLQWEFIRFQKNLLVSDSEKKHTFFGMFRQMSNWEITNAAPVAPISIDRIKDSL